MEVNTNTKGQKKFIKNTGWLIFDKIIHMLMSLIVTGAVARHLGEYDYGIINYGLSFVNIFAIISKMGIDGIIVSELVKDKENEGMIVGTTLGLRMISSFLSILATLIFVYLLNPSEWIVVIVTVIESFSLIGLLFDTIDYYFQANLSSKYSALARTLSYPIVCVYRLVLVWLNANLMWFAFASVIDAVSIGLLLVWFYRKSGGKKLSFSWVCGRRLLSQGKHFILVNLLVTIYTQMDRLMLGGLADQSQVGLYSAAMTISNLWIFIPNALIDSARPIIMELKYQNKEILYQKRWRQIHAAIIWVSICAGVFVTIFGKLAVWIIYGEAFFGALSILLILIWSRLFSLLGVLRSTWMLCEGLEKYIKYFIGLGAAMNLMLNFVLIPQFGAEGAAVATLLTEMVSSFVVSALYRKTRGLTKHVLGGLLLRGIR